MHKPIGMFFCLIYIISPTARCPLLTIVTCVCGYFTTCIIMRWCAISILTLRTQVIHELLVHRACGFVAGIVALICVHRCLSVSREQQMRSCWSFRIGAMQSWDDTNLLQFFRLFLHSNCFHCNARFKSSHVRPSIVGICAIRSKGAFMLSVSRSHMST